MSTKKACVMGWPVSHSLSPVLHRYWLNKYNIDGAYTAMAVLPEHLKEALRRIADQDFAGCNLTMPLKQSSLSAMDEHDESCLMSGAVNTVVINNGKIKGFNSDGFGFVENLKAKSISWEKDRVVILGSGGAACGVIASLAAEGVKYFALVNRDRTRADKIIKNFKISGETIPWEERHAILKDATLLVNCTSLGMIDQPELDLDLSALPKTTPVCDVVYQQLMTDLLKRAAARGNPVVDGLGMLLHQGRLGFDYWFGRDPEVTQDLYNHMKGAVI